MFINVLFITKNIEFAITIKGALERTGAFDVHPFTSPDAAIDYLLEVPHDVALIDFTIPKLRIDVVIGGLRKASPEIAIVAIPRQPEEVQRMLRFQNSLDAPFNARTIIPVLNKAVTDAQRIAGLKPPPPPETLPESPSSKPLRPRLATDNDDTPIVAADDYAAEWQRGGHDPQDKAFEEILSSIDPNDQPESRRKTPVGEFDNLVNSMRGDQSRQHLPARHQQFVDLILTGGMNPLIDQIEQARTDTNKKPTTRKEDDSQRLFRRLAEDEPPMPTLEESGTVTDLFMGVTDGGFRDVISILRGEEPEANDQPVKINRADFYDEQPDAPQLDALMREDTPDSGSAPVVYDFDSVSPPNIDADDAPVKRILRETLDNTKSLDSFSLEELIANIERQMPSHKPQVNPLPSWTREGEVKRGDTDRYVREPDFLADLPQPDSLPEMLPPLASDPMSLSARYAEQMTRASDAQEIEQNPGDLETEWLPAPKNHEPPTTFPEAIIPAQPDTFPEDAQLEHWQEVVEDDSVWGGDLESEADHFSDKWDSVSPFIESDATDVWDDQAQPISHPIPQQADDPFELPRFNTEEFNTEFERLAAFDFAMRENITQTEDAESVEDSYLAQLALSLTQVSLELTAEATLLTRDEEGDGEMVAYAGHMDALDIEELRQTIAHDWDVQQDEARIRFITLQGSGKDYMLYSRRTVDGLILSLVFAGAMPLRDIRQQGRRLVEALESIPEVGGQQNAAAQPELGLIESVMTGDIVGAEPASPPHVGSFTLYAIVWLMRDPNTQLTQAVAKAITAGLTMQLREQYWRVQDLQARDEYMYLLVDIPGEDMPYQIIRDLQRRSAMIAHKHDPNLPETLWSDAYLVVTPGRELDEEEIQQFINFERMAY